MAEAIKTIIGADGDAERLEKCKEPAENLCQLHNGLCPSEKNDRPSGGHFLWESVFLGQLLSPGLKISAAR